MELSRAKILGAGGALAALSPVLFGNLMSAASAADEGDVAILNYAITYERAGIKAYTDAAGTGLLSAPVLAVAKGFMTDHMAHRDALIAAVKSAGGTPTDATAQLKYPALKTQNDILMFAESVERGAATAYLGAIPKLKDPNLAKAAASIMGVETTHVAILAYTLTKSTEPYTGFVA